MVAARSHLAQLHVTPAPDAVNLYCGVHSISDGSVSVAVESFRPGMKSKEKAFERCLSQKDRELFEKAFSRSGRE